MGNLHQLCFEFTFFERPRHTHWRKPSPWRERLLLRRYGLSEAQARTYVALLGLPGDRDG